MPVGPLTTEYLRRRGYKREQINRFTGETRLFQDIGLYGDNADDDLRALEQEFKVDLSSFPFHRYFPGETGLHHFILTFFWRTKWGENVRQKYPPLTLDMIEESMNKKRWAFD